MGGHIPKLRKEGPLWGAPAPARQVSGETWSREQSPKGRGKEGGKATGKLSFKNLELSGEQK